MRILFLFVVFASFFLVILSGDVDASRSNCGGGFHISDTESCDAEIHCTGAGFDDDYSYTCVRYAGSCSNDPPTCHKSTCVIAVGDSCTSTTTNNCGDDSGTVACDGSCTPPADVSGETGTDSCGTQECGTTTDACGTTVNCGSCSGDDTCSAGSCVADCTDTCASLGYECGTHTICGSSTNCGSCSGDDTCNAGVCEADSPDPYCGDGSCNGDETCSTCSTDCGTCDPGDPVIEGSPACGDNQRAPSSYYRSSSAYIYGWDETEWDITSNTDWGDPGFCSEGWISGTNPSYPSPGDDVTWQCSHVDGTITCGAARESCPSGYSQAGNDCVLACVDILGARVSDAQPLENSQIQVFCDVDPSGHSDLKIPSTVNSLSGDATCTHVGWSGSEAEYNCNVGSVGSKTFTCTTKDYRCQDGGAETVTVNVQSSNCNDYSESTCGTAPVDCEWCEGPECQNGEYQANHGTCVDQGSCLNRVCSIDFCGGSDTSTPARCDSGDYLDSCTDLGYTGGSFAGCNTNNPDDASTPLCMPYTGGCYNECGGVEPTNAVLGSDELYGEDNPGNPSMSWTYTSDSSPNTCEFTCVAPTPHYNSSSNSCVGCLIDDHCAEGQACSANSCKDVDVELSVTDEEGAPVSQNQNIVACNNSAISATCDVTLDGMVDDSIDHELMIEPGCGTQPWSCEDDTYTVTCAAVGYPAEETLTFTLDTPTSEISGIVYDENDDAVSGHELDISLLRKGVEINSSEQVESDYSFVVDTFGEHVVTVTADNFDLNSESVLVECNADVTQHLTLSQLSCTDDCTSGYGVCNYGCLGEGGCSLNQTFFDDYAEYLNTEFETSITGQNLTSELQNRCSGASPGDRRAVPGYPGHSFVCCGSAVSGDPIREFGVVPASVESDARHLVSFTKIVNYGGLPVKMNVFVKSD